MMEQKLNWHSNYNTAMEQAKKMNRPMLLFFHSEHCSGCKAMIAKTLPDGKVASQVDQRFVPAMFEISEKPNSDLVKKYNIEWTPTFIIADSNGNEAYRTIGYLPPDDYMSELSFGEGRLAFKSGDYERAAKCFERVYSKHPTSQIAPEAMYYAGVSRYKRSGDASALNNAYTDLKRAYPDNMWTKKASVWSK